MADVEKIALAQEELDVTTRVRAADTVKVSVHVDTDLHQVDLQSAREDITIETVELGHEVAEAPTIRTVGNVTIIPVVEEEAVVIKRLILRREIRLTKTRTETSRTESVPLRKARAVVERIPARPRSPDMDNYDSYDSSRDDQTSQSSQRTIAALFASEDDAKNAKDAQKDACFDHVDLTKNTDAQDAGEARDTHEHGFWDSIKNFFSGDDDAHVYGEGVRRGHSLVTVHTGQARAGEAVEILDRYSPVDIDRSEQEWRSEGWSAERSKERERASFLDARDDSPDRLASDRGADAGREEVIPVVEEKLAVGKRDVEGGNVRVRSYVREIPVNQQVDLRQENVSVERRPVDRDLDDADRDAFRERTVEMTERNEEPVVDKSARVTEEVVVRKDVDTRTQNVSDTVRKTEVEVDGDDEDVDQRTYDPAHH